MNILSKNYIIPPSQAISEKDLLMNLVQKPKGTFELASKIDTHLPLRSGAKHIRVRVEYVRNVFSPYISIKIGEGLDEVSEAFHTLYPYKETVKRRLLWMVAEYAKNTLQWKVTIGQIAEFVDLLMSKNQNAFAN